MPFPHSVSYVHSTNFLCPVSSRACIALGFCMNLASSPFLHTSFAFLAQVLKLRLDMSLDRCLHSSGVFASSICFCTTLSPNTFAFIC